MDGNGNRVGVTSNAGAESYTLDGLNRITNATYPGALSETFSYDAAGNRTSHTNIDGATVGYTVDATGQLVSDTAGTTYSYDEAGNLTATSAGEAYVYDDFGRATEITIDGITEQYTYDAQDVRVTVDGTTQLWDRNGLPTLISTGAGDNYVHAAGIARDGDDWLLQDAVGSVRATVDQAGVVSAETAFTAFGEPLTGQTDSFGFAGEQLDTTGLLHLRARQYNPSVGRFTTVDPVQPGAPGTTGYNLYTYAANNPTTFTDPTGQAVLTESAVVRNLAIGGLTGAEVLGLSVAATFLTSASICLSALAPSCPPSFDFPDIGVSSAPTPEVAIPIVSNPAPNVSPAGATNAGVLGGIAGTVAGTLLTSTTATTTTTTSTTASGRLPVLFGQRRVSSSNFFGNITNPRESFFEDSLLRVFATPVFPGVLIAINNRTLATLSLAGRTSPIASCITSPSADEIERLFESALPPAVTLPSRTVPVTAAIDDPTPVSPFAVTSTVSIDVRRLLPCTPAQLERR